MKVQTEDSTPTPAKPGSPTVEPRTHVNSAMTQTYVPHKGTPARAGSEDHKRYTTKGSPT